MMQLGPGSISCLVFVCDGGSVKKRTYAQDTLPQTSLMLRQDGVFCFLDGSFCIVDSEFYILDDISQVLNIGILDADALQVNHVEQTRQSYSDISLLTFSILLPPFHWDSSVDF